MNRYEALLQYFGYNSFRPGQENLITALLQGHDVLGIMPTGGGKSVCYQIPALLLPGITLVISPLISLMQDQVNSLKNAGIPAAYINSSLTYDQIRKVYHRMRNGAYKIIYIAPERLESDSFRQSLSGLQISLLAVDEAHCISQWGQDFRPSYLSIADFLNFLPCRPPVGAFTATATDEVRDDIIRLLELHDPLTVVTGFDRSNLYYEVRSMHETEKPAALRKLLFSRASQSGIVYCSTRAGTERVCADLALYGIHTACYHAGMSEEERRKSQEDFQFDRIRVMVATNAFGMGIDKSNVSYVIHYNMPKSLEAYYQEAGRAGRDGAPAECFLLFSESDVRTARFLIQNSGNEALTEDEQAFVREQDLQRLTSMISYCKTSKCLRGTLLDYFGQRHPEVCCSCHNCQKQYDMQDITISAQMILSCIRRIHTQIHKYPNEELLLRVLRGDIEELDLQQLSTYGLMRDFSREQISEFTNWLESLDYLFTNEEGRKVPTAKANEVLFHQESVRFPVRIHQRAHALRALPLEAGDIDNDLLERLKELRLKLARRKGVPVYVILSNSALTNLARYSPANIEELQQIKGLSRNWCEQYGESFLCVLNGSRTD